MATRSEQMKARAAAMAARNIKPEPVIEENPPVVEVTTTPIERIQEIKGIALPQVDLSRQITQQDLIMPRLLLSQAMSKVNQQRIVDMGNWYHSTNNENLGQEVFAIPVGMWKHRSYFEQGVGILCRSFDLIQGEGDPGILCEGTPDERYTLPDSERGCPLRLWGERDPKTNKSKPPRCGINYNFPLLIVASPEDPESATRRAMVTFRSTQTAVAKRLISIVSEGDYEWTDVLLRFGVTSRTNQSGTFYNATIDLVGPSQGRPKEKAEAFSKSLNVTSIRATLERDDTSDD